MRLKICLALMAAALEASAASASDTDSSEVVFPPDRDDNANTRERVSEEGDCHAMGLVWMEGECRQLGEAGPCTDRGPDGQEKEWVVLDIRSKKPKCQIRPCPKGQVLFAGSCLDLGDPSPCDANLVLTVNPFGGGECGCRYGEVYGCNEGPDEDDLGCVPEGERRTLLALPKLPSNCQPGNGRSPPHCRSLIRLSTDDDPTSKEREFQAWPGFRLARYLSRRGGA